jgi:hypothetical protein
MPYALVFDLSIVYPNRHIRATTHGNGVFERSLVSNPLLGIVNNGQLPKEFRLFQNYPNPFNPSAKVKFDIAKAGNVTLSVFDITGRLVTSLVNERLQPGSYEVKFDGTSYSSGIYFYRIQAGDPSTSSGQGYTDTKKMILLK